MTLYQRNETLGAPKLTAPTAIIPAKSPTNAPTPRARGIIARRNTPENQAVEKRPKSVDDLDERAKCRRVGGNDTRKQTPARGGHLRRRPGSARRSLPAGPTAGRSRSPLWWRVSSARAAIADIAAAITAAMNRPASQTGSSVENEVGDDIVDVALRRFWRPGTASPNAAPRTAWTAESLGQEHPRRFGVWAASRAAADRYAAAEDVRDAAPYWPSSRAYDAVSICGRDGRPSD